MNGNQKWRVAHCCVGSKDICPMILNNRNELLGLERKNKRIRCFKLLPFKNTPSPLCPQLQQTPTAMEENPSVPLSSFLSNQTINSASLAYNSEHGTSYLLMGDPLTIFDISDISNSSCRQPVYPNGNTKIVKEKLLETPHIFVTNDFMFIPTETDGTQKLHLSSFKMEHSEPIYCSYKGKNIFSIKGTAL